MRGEGSGSRKPGYRTFRLRTRFRAVCSSEDRRRGGRPALDDTIPEFDPRDVERVHALYSKYRLEDAGPPLQPAG